MGSIDNPEPLLITFSFPVDVPIAEYDPWQLPYGKAPNDLVHGRTANRTLPLKDFREDVLGQNYSLAKSARYLRDHGFTAVRHKTALHAPPYGQTDHFLDADLVDSVYYAEIRQLMKDVTGCSEVFVTDSLVRSGDAAVGMKVTDKMWQKTAESKAGENVSSSAQKPSTRIHKTTPTPPARVPHWDFNPLGARQTIRNWSEDITTYAEKLGIMAREDELCASVSATDAESNTIIDEHYDGPRYACFSVWRPLKTVTRDPLVMAPYQSVKGDPDMRAVTHRIKQPGTRGDWLRELATLKVTEEAAEKMTSGSTQGLEWRYVSNLEIDEVLLVKAFDSAALSGQARMTGEAPAAVHASPDLGDAGHGGPRESIEVRLVAFW